MDLQTAIRLLHPSTTREALAEIEYYGGFDGRAKAIEAINEACTLACNIMQKVLDGKMADQTEA